MALKEELKHQGDILFRYRSHLPLLLFAVGVGMKYYLIKIASVQPSTNAETIKLAAISIGIIGLLVRIYTLGYTAKHTSGRNTDNGQVANELNTTGIYSLIRNPLYVGNYLMWLAPAMLIESVSFCIVFSLIFWIYYERIIYAEEAFLREKFGDVYLKWAEKVPVFLPTHLSFVKPAIPFNYKKVLKKEYIGLFALFTLFLFFELFDNYLITNTFNYTESWVSQGFVVSGVLLVLLTIVKKFTRILK